MRRKTIFTHILGDLDSLSSLWAGLRFVPGMENAEICFKPVNWDGTGMEDGDMAVDIYAGGKGIKGEKEESGVVHSCFATIMERYAPQEDGKILDGLITFIDVEDAHGSAVECLANCDPARQKSELSALSATSLCAVLRAFQAIFPNDDKMIFERMSEIFDGMLEVGRAYRRAEKEADKAEILPGGKVAIVTNAKERGTTSALYRRGVRFIIFVKGNDLGITRERTETLRTDHPELRAVVEKAGEISEWYPHPAGFLFCRGSDRCRAETPSKVNPRELAKIAAQLLG